jgi:Flp pilus assembly protein TadG
MFVQIRKRRNREKGASLFVAIAGLVWVVIPMMGLFVDLGILYSAKARLQAAVDGAALAAARALNLGQTTAEQATSAKQNAVNWFYANFPPGNWSTTGTLMDTSDAHVSVVDSPNQANLRQVTVTASTNVPAWFMRYVGFTSTALTVTGQASRRDVVAMLVLDRSGSMCSINGGVPNPPCGANDGTPCASMITAAKNFTGAFAAGRDQIGMLTFADGYYLDSKPTTNFQTLLGYSNASSSGAGAIDNITCAGGTGTAAAVSMAYNELYKLSEPGAMNILMLETDGLPNTLVYNFWDGSSAAIQAGADGSNCTDANNKTVAQGGWKTQASMRGWIPGGISMNTNGTGFMSDISNGSIGGFYAADPSQVVQNGGVPYHIVLFDPRQTSDSSGNSDSVAISNANNCAFNGSTTTDYSDFAWLPSQDVFGNQIAPANEYQSLTLNGSNHLVLTNNANTDWPNTHAAALNGTDNAAYNARANATLPAYIFTIGLGGNHGNPPDPVLLQRMANDPNADQFNNPAVYPACSTEPTCISYASQPQGQFIYAPTSAQLGQAFLAISSQILRLSH